MTDVFRTMIVTTSQVALARTLGAGLSPGGAGMFTTGLSPTGTGTPTHYVSTGMIADQYAEAITSGASLHAAVTSRGASVTLAQCDALVNTSDVSQDDPFVAFERLGLKMVVTNGN